MEIEPEIDAGETLLDDFCDWEKSLAKAEVLNISNGKSNTSKDSDEDGRSDSLSDISMEKMPKQKLRKFDANKEEKEKTKIES